MRRSSITVLLLVSALAFVAGCGSSGGDGKQADNPVEELDAFYKSWFEYTLKGQHGRTWESLHPGQQAIVPRSRFEDCRDEAADALSSLGFKSLDVIDVYDEPIDVPGIPEKTAKAVKVKVTVELDSEQQSFTDTVHAVEVDGRWRWILGPSNIAAYQAGECP